MAGKRGRKKKADDPFYIKVNEEYRVARDTFNIIVTRKVVPDNGAAIREESVGFGSTLQFAAELLLREGAPADVVENFRSRVAAISTSFKDGRLVVKPPKDFVFDQRDIVTAKAA
jgi:hypothetical protein